MQRKISSFFSILCTFSLVFLLCLVILSVHHNYGHSNIPKDGRDNNFEDGFRNLPQSFLVLPVVCALFQSRQKFFVKKQPVLNKT